MILLRWTFPIMLLIVVTPASAARDEQIEGALSNGIGFLARQQADDGAIADSDMRIASSGLSLLAFLGAGHVPDVGRHGLNVRRLTEFLVRSVPEDGNAGRIDGSGTYGQAVVTLALCEAYAVETDSRQRALIRTAVDRCISALWVSERNPQPIQGDLPQTALNILAMRAAREIGIDVPNERIDSAIQDVLKCFNSQRKDFARQLNGEPSSTMTAIAVTVLSMLGASERLDPALRARPITQLNDWNTADAYVTAFCLTLAALHGGDLRVWQASANTLLAEQAADGGWPDSGRMKRVYSTSLAVLTLSAPKRILISLEK